LRAVKVTSHRRFARRLHRFDRRPLRVHDHAAANQLGNFDHRDSDTAHPSANRFGDGAGQVPAPDGAQRRRSRHIRVHARGEPDGEGAGEGRVGIGPAPASWHLGSSSPDDPTPRPTAERISDRLAAASAANAPHRHFAARLHAFQRRMLRAVRARRCIRTCRRMLARLVRQLFGRADS
jgi:hypothetical protein